MIHLPESFSTRVIEIRALFPTWDQGRLDMILAWLNSLSGSLLLGFQK